MPAIDPDQPYGQHIVLTCVNHPDLRWTTKNIDFIGARSIFFSGWREGLTECNCHAGFLRVVKETALSVDDVENLGLDGTLRDES